MIFKLAGECIFQGEATAYPSENATMRRGSAGSCKQRNTVVGEGEVGDASMEAVGDPPRLSKECVEGGGDIKKPPVSEINGVPSRRV